MASATCPTCHKAFDPAASRALPFCSERCRQIDLKRWLNQEISIPYVEADESDESRHAELPDDTDD